MIANNRPRGRLGHLPPMRLHKGAPDLEPKIKKFDFFSNFDMDFFRNRVRSKAPTVVVSLILCAHQIEIILAFYDRCLSSLALKKIESRRILHSKISNFSIFCLSFFRNCESSRVTRVFTYLIFRPSQVRTNSSPFLTMCCKWDTCKNGE